MTFDPESIVPPGAKIKVIGIGGGGGNAVNTMIKSALEGVDFITANTDVQSLRFSLADHKIQLGKLLTKGLGAGANPEIGRDAALEDREELEKLIDGADMVFITAGMGGGTGTGGASVIAQVAREAGALTVAVVTKPFLFEGKKRRRNADDGIERLRECVDTLITIPNQRLLHVATPDLSMIDAFKLADDVLVNAVRGISDIINIPGIVNVDFADVKTVMASMGQALMGIGSAIGDNRAQEAAKQAIQSPLLEDINIEGATGILINITSGQNISLMEVNAACSIIQEAAHEDANIIIGAVIDEDLTDEIRVTVIATGFPLEEEEGDVIDRLKQQPPMAIPKPAPDQRAKPAFPDKSATSSPTPTVPTSKPASPAAEPKQPEPIATQPPLAPQVRPEPEPEIIPEPPSAAKSEVAQKPVEPATKQPDFETDFGVVAQSLTDMTLGDEDSSDIDEDIGINMTSLQAPLEEPEEDLPISANPTGRPIEGAMAAGGQDEADEEFRRSQEPMPKPEESTAKKNESTGSVAEQLFDESDPEPEMESSAQMTAEEPNILAEEEMDLSGDPPMESLFDDKELAIDIDKKIDEALELAEKIKQPELNDDDDDIDVPTFLRNGMKDLPLS